MRFPAHSATASVAVILLASSATAQTTTPVAEAAPPPEPAAEALPIPVPPVPVAPVLALPPVPVPIPVPPVPMAPAPKPHLRDSFVYIYSYMDMRDDFFGAQTLTMLDEKIVATLKTMNVSAKVVRYKSTDVYKQTLADDEFRADSVDLNRGSKERTAVPVGNVIKEKLEDEKASGAKYRLILFPKNFTTSGAWRFYTLTWAMYDIETGRKVWSHVYNGEHLVWWKEEENINGRSQKIVDDLSVAIGKDGLAVP